MTPARLGSLIGGAFGLVFVLVNALLLAFALWGSTRPAATARSVAP